MSDRHAVFAVLDVPAELSGVEGHRVRVSESLHWSEAQDAHNALHQGIDDTDPMRPVTNPGYTCLGRKVKWFAVRSMDDPGWPASGTVLPLRDYRHGVNRRVPRITPSEVSRQRDIEDLLTYLNAR